MRRFILIAILTGLVCHLPCQSGQSFFTKGSWPAFTGGFAVSVKVVGGLAAKLTASEGGDVFVFDVSNPANPRPVGLANVPSAASGVSAVGSTVYASTWYHGLQVLQWRPSLRLASWLPQTSVTLELNGEPGSPITLEAATHLTPSTVWSPVVTTNPPSLPILVTDTAVDSEMKFYRVQQQP